MWEIYIDQKLEARQYWIYSSEWKGYPYVAWANEIALMQIKVLYYFTKPVSVPIGWEDLA